MRKKITYIISALVTVLCGCGKLDSDTQENHHNRADFISLAEIATLSPQQILEGIGGSEKEMDSLDFQSKLLYTVKAYRLSYYTDFMDGETVEARALLLVPQGVEQSKLLAYMHGTVIPSKIVTTVFGLGVPSEYEGKKYSLEVMDCGLPMASAGYCVVMPDYTGYGPTSDREHPYVYMPELYKSAIDGIYCARKTLRNEFGLDAGKQLWLAGWSQGGALALYLHRELENNPIYKEDFQLMGTSTLAGPFNLRRFMMEIMSRPDEYHLLMMVYSWAGYALNYFAPQLRRPTDQIFRYPVYDQTDSYLTSAFTARDLFSDILIQGFRNGTDKSFLDVLEQCSTVTDSYVNEPQWTPEAPVFLHHGTKDTVVPCINSQSAYDGLKHSGAVQLFLYKDQDHMTFVPTYSSKTIEEFAACR